MPKKLTTEEFIQRSTKVHGGFYDYSSSVYTKGKDKICVICPVHGEFYHDASSHLAGIGCRACAYERNSITITETNWVSDERDVEDQPFVKKARLLFNDRFDYSKVEYINAHTSVVVICKEHNKEFETTPNTHLNKKVSCPGCRRDRACLGTEGFIKKATNIHGNKYDYSNVKLTTLDTTVEISCPVHGPFMQKASNHLVTKGCQKCSYDESQSAYMAYYRTNKPSNLYVIEIDINNEKFIKVGLSNSLRRRFATIKHNSGCTDIKLLHKIEGTASSLWELERSLHFKSGIKKHKDEDWSWRGRYECYPLSSLDDILGYLQNNSDIVVPA